MQCCRESRRTWERFLAPDRVMDCLQQVLAKELPVGSMESETFLSDHQKGMNAYLAGDPETADFFSSNH